MFFQPVILKIFKFTAKLREQYSADLLLTCCHIYQFLFLLRQLKTSADSMNLEKDAFLRNHTICTPQQINSNFPVSANKQLVIQVHILPVVPNMPF